MEAVPRPEQANEPSFLGDLQLDESSFNDYELDLGLENPLTVGGIANNGPLSSELWDTTRRPTKDGEVHDKRKNPGDDESDDDGGSKRREGAEKTVKKPGRKPLTSEPTTVCAPLPRWRPLNLGFRLTMSRRNVRRRTAPRSEHSESERRNI